MLGKPAEGLATGVVASSPVPDGCAGSSTGTERTLAEVLAEVVGVERVPVDGHFFDDLGANSLVMAHFCARVRKRGDLPSVSMKDIYRHPTIRSLAATFATDEPTPAETRTPAPAEVVVPASTARYVLCGALQFLLFLGYAHLVAFVGTGGYQWISDGSGLAEVYLRSVGFGGAAFLGVCAFPIVVKWVLVGRWKAQRFPVWSLAYVRFWAVRTLVRTNPVVLFAGTPIYGLYLRALGAKIGRGVVILSKGAPACPDLLTVGDGTVIRKDSSFSCYRAQAGVIETGPVTLGKNVFVSEATVIDIGTSMGDGAQLGHASSLHTGQAVPDGERWHGSPAQRCDVDFLVVPPAACGTARRAVYAVMQLLSALVLYLPLSVGGVRMLLTEFPELGGLLTSSSPAFASWAFYRDALATSAVLLFGAVLIGLLLVTAVPRVLNLAITPGKVYCLYGFHYSVHRTITRLTNIRFLTRLFGDSSYIVHYLRALGYDLSRVRQTGSNFGTEVKQETPFLSSVGSGTMVADGLSIMNADFSSTSFRVARTSIGSRSFLGNRIAYPSQGRTGDNCLLATKVMVPIDGEVREGVGLLGSPSFEIPRSVERDSKFDHLKNGEEFRRVLAAKNRHNVITMVLCLLSRWIYFFGLVLLAWGTGELYPSFGASAIALLNVLALGFSVGYFALLERTVTASHALTPLYCSIYDLRFWRRERYWKVPAETYLQALNGTPFKNVLWRMLGVRIGRRVFDDGCYLTERTLVSIGDDCTLNAGTVIQCHSQEDGAFKSDRSTIGAGCTLGVGSFVHYGVTMGDGAVLGADAFLMKGEEVPRGARWSGNPAREIRAERLEPSTSRA
ncbi:Pls/PosA family non-ribosomal peptide synthetase [Allokutzneria oryzae]|uniref:Pls/PosA family non-ribosomal peptide synthetase n=1 Tax=Allokutzneria oryzae TaxID=1378989 RepID=A0ABV5ZQN6_9PSEU